MRKCENCGDTITNRNNKKYCSRLCYGEDKRETFNVNWKGDDVGYVALHKWVANKRGKPTKCEHCGKIEENSRKIQWANKSGKYLRDLDDWIRLHN